MISILVALIILGLILWAVSLLPIDPTIMTIIRVVAVIAVVIWLLRLLVPGAVATL